MSTAYHMVHYRRFEADVTVLKGKTLEVLCREALNTENGASKLWARPEDRVFDVGDSDSRKIFLNKVADLSDAVFGEMCLAQAKDLQTLLKMEPTEVELSDLTTATVYDLNEREAPDGSSFIRGLAYWIAIGNHVLFVKTHSMTPELLRLYLDWLLKSRGAVVDPALSFALNAEFDKTAAAGDIGEIRNLRVTGKSAPQAISIAEEPTKREVKTSRRVADRFAEMKEAVPIIQQSWGPRKRSRSLIVSVLRSIYRLTPR